MPIDTVEGPLTSAGLRRLADDFNQGCGSWTNAVRALRQAADEIDRLRMLYSSSQQHTDSAICQRDEARAQLARAVEVLREIADNETACPDLLARATLKERAGEALAELEATPAAERPEP